jgi:exopolysaccharide biosynthesis polyprenyl glycosylphosphotransferase
LGLLLFALWLTIVINYSSETDLSVTNYSLEFLSSHIKLTNAVLFGLLMVVWHICFKIQGLYYSLRFGNRPEIIIRTAKSAAACSIALFFAAEIATWGKVNLFNAICFWSFSCLLIGAMRLTIMYGTRRFRRRGINSKTLLIIGGGARSRVFIRIIRSQKELGYKILGYLDSEPDFSHEDIDGVEWLGNIEDLPSFISSSAIDEVAIALPIKSQYMRIKQAVSVLEEQGIVTHIVSDFFPHQLARIQPQEFQGLPILSLHSAPPFCWKTDVKRVIDIVVSLAMLVALSPLLIAIAIIIKVDSKGPVFFLQKRMGFNKRRFYMIKFRSMGTDAESKLTELEHLNEKDGGIFKIRNDPRITRVGHFLRKFSLDEFPQLINVLKGEMSLVGPRPLSMRDAMNLEESTYKRRYSVRPGMTCLWQVSGRSELSFDEWMELDLEYIDSWSLKLDGKILMQTVPAVLTARGAF